MRFGIITDGQAETYALPPFLRVAAGSHTVVGPLYADIQPMAPKLQIARAVKSRVLILMAKSVDVIIVLLDLETRHACPGIWAEELASEIRSYCTVGTVYVVIKNATFENWLIADLQALRKHAKRFQPTRSHEQSISPNKADGINGTRLLKSMVVGPEYSKVKDAVKILRHARPEEVARNSRSFRRLLHLLRHPRYSSQSKLPAYSR